MFVDLERDWEGRTAVLIGGGHSAYEQPVHRLHGSGLIAVAINDAVRHLPWADVVFSIDMVWMRNRVDELRAFKGEKLMGVFEGTPEFAGERQLVRKTVAGLSRDMGIVFTGENSGFAALGMAMMRGAQTIVLVGYDMGKAGHWHGGYEWKSKPTGPLYPKWASWFGILAREAKNRGQVVFNTNPRSAIKAFPFAPLEDFLG